MIGSRLAGLTALFGAAVLALALLTQAIVQPSPGIAVFGFGLLTVSTFLVSFLLRRVRPVLAALGMVAVALGSSLAILAGRDFAGNLSAVPVVGLGVGIPFITVPIVAIAAAQAGLVRTPPAYALAGSTVLVLLSTPLAGIASIVSFALYIAAWGWMGLSLIAHARPSRVPETP